MQAENEFTTDDDSAAEDIQDLMLRDENISTFLQDLALLGTELFSTGGEVPVGVMSKRGNAALTVASSSPVAVALDELQYRVGEGPALNALRTGQAVVVDDAHTDPRWARYFASTSELGYRAVLSIPLQLGGEGGATLNFYGTAPHFFTPEMTHAGEVFAAQAGKALEMAMRVSRHQDTSDNLRAAMKSRTSIDIAVGIIIAQNRCTQEKAFEILTQASNTRNQKIRDLAEELISNTSGAPAHTHYTN